MRAAVSVVFLALLAFTNAQETTVMDAASPTELEADMAPALGTTADSAAAPSPALGSEAPEVDKALEDLVAVLAEAPTPGTGTDDVIALSPTQVEDLEAAAPSVQASLGPAAGDLLAALAPDNVIPADGAKELVNELENGASPVSVPGPAPDSQAASPRDAMSPAGMEGEGAASPADTTEETAASPDAPVAALPAAGRKMLRTWM